VTAAAADNGDPGPFAKGSKHLTVLGGTGSAFDESYIVLGAGGSYYVLDGLNVGVQIEAWLDGDPRLFKVSPSVNYVFHMVPRFSPYAGAFYRYTDVENYSNYDSVGARAGVYYVGGTGYAGVGVVYESYLDCDEQFDLSCDEVYPEFSFTFAF
jgi:hypothetical protein